MATSDNTDDHDPVAALAQLGNNPQSAVYLEPPCAESAILQMQEVAIRELGEAVPDGYLRLLRMTNGVQINGAYFKSAAYLVPENLDVFYPSIVVLGNDGNTAWFVFDTRDRRFHLTNFEFPSERFASFDSFELLLQTVMREQQVT